MASELARAKATIANQRKRGDELEATVVRKAVITVTAATTAFAENKGMQAAYFGVPTKVGIAALASLGEALSRDKTTRRFLGAIADSELAAYSYAAVRAGTFIAGDGGSL